MSELVEEMQERLLPEYEQMQKFQICTEDQLRDCIQKRGKFQTRITKNNKSMRDYLDYIIFERKIHKWVCEKEEALGRKLTGLKASIAKRILHLYRAGLKRFPDEERLWNNFIQFCKKSSPHEVASIYERMLTFYGDHERVWCDAALWAYEFGGYMSKVKEIFFRALLRHPKSEIISKSFFDILLMHASKMSDEKNLDGGTKSEQDIGLEMLKLAYIESKKNIKNISYFISLLERCEEREYANITIKLQKDIIDDLIETYANVEELWDALAQRELRGFSTSDLRRDTTEPVCENEETNESKLVWIIRTEKQKIELCSKVYETAVKTLQTEKMWTLYINAMLRLNQEADTELPLKRKRLALAFKEGQETSLLSDGHLDAYVRMLMVSPTGVETAKNVLEKFACNRSSLKFFELCLLLYTVEKDESKIDEIFNKAKSTLGCDSLPTWRRVIDFYKSERNTKKLNQIYRDAAQQPKKEFGKLRAEYLEYCLETTSMDKTRNTYTELSQLPPPCLEMHQKMLELETKTNSTDRTRLRLYHENIVYFFGKSNPQVWIDYIEFERNNGEARHTTVLYNRAKATLEPHFVDVFITEHTLNINKNC